MTTNKMRNLCIGAILGASVLSTPALSESLTLKALGQPGATGLIQENLEAPFFANFAKNTGLDINISFQTLDQTGIKGAEELRILKSGLFDIISLRLQQVSRDEPILLGLDLVGQNPTFAEGRKSMAEFSPAVDQRLQKKFDTKLLGLWPFGPQVLFCNAEIGSLADVKGLKVRTYDQNLANFVSSIGGTPVPLGFADVHQSLARGVVDCAITGPSSANSASWPEETTHVLPLAYQIAVQGYGMNLKVWNKFSAEEQAKIQKAFDKHTDDIWAYSKELFDDAMRCNVGETPCELNKPYKLVNVPVSDADIATVQNAVKTLSVPAWAVICDKKDPTCSSDWKATVGKRFGF
jgi:TRAP-type C4-dicarboxylate transport system substrate-binding protein